MRHPRRARNIYAAFAAASVVVVATGLVVAPDKNTLILILALGLQAAVIMAVLASVAHFRDVVPHKRMARGEGVLARWQINQARWEIGAEQKGIRTVAWVLRFGCVAFLVGLFVWVRFATGR